MFAYRHDILKAMIADGVRLVVLGPNESLADLPEFSDPTSENSWPKVDAVARVLNYDSKTKLLVVAQENVLGDPSDPMVGSNQVISVFADAIHKVTGTRPVDPNWEKRGRSVQQYELRVKRLDIDFDKELRRLYSQAMAAKKWLGTTSVHGHVPYWTAGVLAYFDAVGQVHSPNDATHPIATREALKSYDPDLYEFVNKTMAYDHHVDWRFSR